MTTVKPQTIPLPLAGVLVTEYGGREGVAICGNLLRHLGADVVVVEAVGPSAKSLPRDQARATYLAGKHSVSIDPTRAEDRARLHDLLGRSDIVLGSSDLQGSFGRPSPQGKIFCDITATGRFGPEAGIPYSEVDLQALLGHMDTTGFVDGPPQAVAFPMVSYLTAAYACAGVLSAYHAYQEHGLCQSVDIAMFDAAFLSLNAFLAGVLTGAVKDRGRMGNQHPTTPAWNLFATADGHVLICAGSQSQWVKLCALIAQPEFLTRFPSAQDRMANLAEIEAAIGAWSKRLSTADAVEALVTAGVAAGPIAPIQGFPREENLKFRGMIQQTSGSAPLFVAGAPVRLQGMDAPLAPRLPAKGEDNDALAAIGAQAPARHEQALSFDIAAPLSGLRVIELGQYTTVPLCSRNLALLGAEVIKVEKPGGDESRSYPPRQGTRSEVYVMMNSSKQSIMLDLQKPEDQAILKGLLQEADILIENNKPGTLERYGLSPVELQKEFPQLIHCAVSGFGIRSIYGDRPGFDTVIQAMSGVMTAVNPGKLPLKTGISAADLMGSEMALVAVLAAVAQRRTTGRGQIIDLSMQDVAAWLTETLWNQDQLAPLDIWLSQQLDGYIVVDLPRDQVEAQLGAAGITRATLSGLTRAAAVVLLTAEDIPAVSVNSVREAADLDQTHARGLWHLEEDAGQLWPVLGDLFSFSHSANQPARRAPDLDADRAAILARLA